MPSKSANEMTDSVVWMCTLERDRILTSEIEFSDQDSSTTLQHPCLLPFYACSGVFTQSILRFVTNLNVMQPCRAFSIYSEVYTSRWIDGAAATISIVTIYITIYFITIIFVIVTIISIFFYLFIFFILYLNHTLELSIFSVCTTELIMMYKLYIS